MTQEDERQPSLVPKGLDGDDDGREGDGERPVEAAPDRGDRRGAHLEQLPGGPMWVALSCREGDHGDDASRPAVQSAGSRPAPCTIGAPVTSSS